jgi:hypothetical protein
MVPRVDTGSNGCSSLITEAKNNKKRGKLSGIRSLELSS